MEYSLLVFAYDQTLQIAARNACRDEMLLSMHSVSTTRKFDRRDLLRSSDIQTVQLRRRSRLSEESAGSIPDYELILHL